MIYIEHHKIGRNCEAFIYSHGKVIPLGCAHWDADDCPTFITYTVSAAFVLSSLMLFYINSWYIQTSLFSDDLCVEPFLVNELKAKHYTNNNYTHADNILVKMLCHNPMIQISGECKYYHYGIYKSCILYLSSLHTWQIFKIYIDMTHEYWDTNCKSAKWCDALISWYYINLSKHPFYTPICTKITR